MRKLAVEIGTLSNTILFVLLALTLVILPPSPAEAQQAPETAPLMFIESNGLTPGDGVTRYLARGEQASLYLAPDALWLTVLEPAEPAALDGAGAVALPEAQTGVNLKLSFMGANPAPTLEPFDRLETRVSSFTGSDPATWQTDQPAWAGVRYVDLYPGLDLEVTSQAGRLVLRLVVRGGDPADPAGPLAQVRLQVEGAETLTLSGETGLLAGTPAGEVPLPLLAPVDMAGLSLADLLPPPEVTGLTVAWPFAEPAGDMPVTAQAAADLLYSSYIEGSNASQNSQSIAVDGAGNFYIAGATVSTDFPSTPGAFRTTPTGDGDGFVVKFKADGSGLAYATFLGGGSASDIAVDEAGNAYVTGRTGSPDFPVTPGSFGSTYAGGTDAFVLKLNSTGTALDYGAFLGGSGDEWGWSIAVDAAGKAYVTGYTASADLPTTVGAVDPTYNGGSTLTHDVFVAGVDSAGASLAYLTYLGGSADDDGQAIAVDAAGNAFVTGQTDSMDFPVTAGAFDTDSGHMFVVKLNSTGNNLEYATYLGGNGNDAAHGIAVDGMGHAYVAGETTSNNLPTTPGSFQPAYHPGSSVTHEGDAFVFKLSPAGNDLVYGTYVGGADRDLGLAVTVDTAGNAFVTGLSYSTDFPTTPTAFQGNRSGYPDVFIARLNPAGNELTYGTYLGGNTTDWADSIAVDGTGNVYVTGYTSSTDFPVTAGALDTDLAGFSAGFVSKLALPAPEPGEPTPTPTPEATPVPVQTCAPAPLGTVPVGNQPRGVAVNPATSRVFVANFGSDSVSVIDGRTNSLITTIPNILLANGAAFDATNLLVWVTNYGTDQVTAISAASLLPLATLPAGDGPAGVAYDPVHNYVYVANSLANSVTVIDGSTRTIVTTLNTGFNQPAQVAANPTTGRVYVSNFGGHSVTVLDGTTVSRVVDLYDSIQPYGLAVDELRDLVYVATVKPNRIVAIGPIPGKGSDQFLGWAAFYRGFGDRHRPLPLRAIAVNPGLGPVGDGGHLWTTTSTADGSETGQALLIPKGWGGYFHYPLVGQTEPALAPEGGIAIDRTSNRVYVASGGTPGTLIVLGDHPDRCPGVAPAEAAPEAPDTFDFTLFSRAALAEGDATGDGQVDIFDLSFIAARYGSAEPTADVNGDGQVDIFDLTVVAGRFGQTIRPE